MLTLGQNTSETAEELQLAAENNIEVIGVWMWVDGRDTAEELENNKLILEQ